MMPEDENSVIRYLMEERGSRDYDGGSELLQEINEWQEERKKKYADDPQQLEADERVANSIRYSITQDPKYLSNDAGKMPMRNSFKVAD